MHLANSASIMFAIAALTSTPALAQETAPTSVSQSAAPSGVWHCTHPKFGGKEGVVRADFLIRGNQLIATVVGISKLTKNYSILQNNKFGLVAVSAMSWDNPHYGPTVGAGFVIIEKATGDLLLGDMILSAGADPSSVRGNCRVE